MTIQHTTVDSIESLEAALASVKEAQAKFATYTQEQVDKIFKAAATAADKGKIVIVTDSSSNTDKVYICVLNNGTYVYKEMTLV